MTIIIFIFSKFSKIFFCLISIFYNKTLDSSQLPNRYLIFPNLQRLPHKLDFLKKLAENVWQFILFSVYTYRFIFSG